MSISDGGREGSPNSDQRPSSISVMASIIFYFIPHCSEFFYQKVALVSLQCLHLHFRKSFFDASRVLVKKFKVEVPTTGKCLFHLLFFTEKVFTAAKWKCIRYLLIGLNGFGFSAFFGIFISFYDWQLIFSPKARVFV